MTTIQLNSPKEESIEFSQPRVLNAYSGWGVRNFVFYRSTVFFALTIVFTALTTVATLLLVIPFPATSGYFNLGDSLVMISGLLLGPVGGFIAGGTGSALADMVAYPHFAPITFIVKGCEGLVVGLFSQQIKAVSRIHLRDILGLLLGACVMLLGYFVAEAFLFGWEAALLELVWVNSIQVTVGIFVALSVGSVVRKYLVSALVL
ncbi:MAG: ECF transporter S component [Candidatus Hodarchaeota archaeon]